MSLGASGYTLKVLENFSIPDLSEETGLKFPVLSQPFALGSLILFYELSEED